MPSSSLTALTPPSTSPSSSLPTLLVDPATGKRVAITTSGKPIQIWHTLNGVRYNDVTKTTNANGKVTFTQK